MLVELLGYSTGEISGCKNNGKTVKGTSSENIRLDIWDTTVADVYTGLYCFTGGIIGYNGISNVTNCENNAEIIGNYGGIGGIIGGTTVAGERAVSGCLNNGKISYNGVATINTSKQSGMAGIIGITWGNCDVINCRNTGEVEGEIGSCAGIVGVNLGSKISECENSGKITGRYVIGGIVGHALQNTKDKFIEITGCINNGKLEGTSTYDGYYLVYYCDSKTSNEITNVGGRSAVGGIVGGGRSFVKIIDCVNYGDANGVGTAVGGILGTCQSEGGRVIINNCENVGNISGKWGVGGCAGTIRDAEIVGVCNKGNVTVTVSNAGGICGIAGACNLTNCTNSGRGYSSYYGRWNTWNCFW